MQEEVEHPLEVISSTSPPPSSTSLQATAKQVQTMSGCPVFQAHRERRHINFLYPEAEENPRKNSQ